MTSPQTRNFPALNQSEQSWELSLRALAGTLFPSVGIISGLVAGLPASGLKPTLTNGYAISGDRVVGPFGAELIGAAPKNATRIGLFYRNTGELIYLALDSTDRKATDLLIAEVSTDNETTAAIRHIAQYRTVGVNRTLVKAFINLEKCAKGADVTFASLPKPAGASHLYIEMAYARVQGAASAGNTAGDDFVLKAGSTALVTLDDAVLVTAGTTVLKTAAATDLRPSTETTLELKYNQTDTSTAITGGVVEVGVLVSAI
ncbi:MAG: hypothetical protein DDT26_00212 [Dehalococcoidia bacterium]|nr:hypothetical protein [Chloroflexota bacterium]